MVTLAKALHCEARVHCRTCRTSAAFRDSLAKNGIVQTPDFACPFGVTAESIPAPRLPAPTACVHRGSEVRRVQCQSCQGVVMAKVLGCALHGECTLFSKPISGVKPCAGCTDRNPPQP